jgi:phosphatidylserine/phosphatidylglycerophosphate/cardiolipin synthase-like enzyme
VFVFHVDNGTEDYTYIHAKIMIIDDFLVTIGSANLNYRSHTHDSEINAMIIDTELAEGKRKFARDLRINLWKEHLNIMSSKEAELKLSNFSIGLECLKKSIRIKKFNAPILSADSLIDDNLYNMLVDPIS